MCTIEFDLSESLTHWATFMNRSVRWKAFQRCGLCSPQEERERERERESYPHEHLRESDRIHWARTRGYNYCICCNKVSLSLGIWGRERVRSVYWMVTFMIRINAKSLSDYACRLSTLLMLNHKHAWSYTSMLSFFLHWFDRYFLTNPFRGHVDQIYQKFNLTDSFRQVCLTFTRIANHWSGFQKASKVTTNFDRIERYTYKIWVTSLKIVNQKA